MNPKYLLFTIPLTLAMVWGFSYLAYGQAGLVKSMGIYEQYWMFILVFGVALLSLAYLVAKESNRRRPKRTSYTNSRKL